MNKYYKVGSLQKLQCMAFIWPEINARECLGTLKRNENVIILENLYDSRFIQIFCKFGIGYVVTNFLKV